MLFRSAFALAELGVTLAGLAVGLMAIPESLSLAVWLMVLFVGYQVFDAIVLEKRIDRNILHLGSFGTFVAAASAFGSTSTVNGVNFAAYNATRPASQQAPVVGLIESRNIQFQNLAKGYASGIDLSLNYAVPNLPIGRATLNADGDLAARITSLGGWLDLAARKLVAPPEPLAAALRAASAPFAPNSSPSLSIALCHAPP